MAGTAGSEDKGTASVAQATGGGSSSKIVLAISAVNLVATLGMVGILFISFQKEKSHQSIEDIAVKSSSEAGEHEKGHGEESKGHGEEAKGGEGHGEGHGGGHGEGEKKKSNSFGKMISLEQFTVNLATPGSVNAKYVRVNISLEVPNEDSESEVNAKIPQVRNAIIDLFNSKRPSDLANAEGRDYLKEEIRNALNSFMTVGKVKGVFFTSFALAG